MRAGNRAQVVWRAPALPVPDPVADGARDAPRGRPAPWATREDLARPARATARRSRRHPPARIPGRIASTSLRHPVLHAKLPGSLHTRPANGPAVPAISHTGATRRAG